MRQRSRADPTCALAVTLFGTRALCFAKDCFFACQRAPRANTHANDTRVPGTIGGKLALLARARDRARASRLSRQKSGALSVFPAKTPKNQIIYVAVPRRALKGVRANLEEQVRKKGLPVRFAVQKRWYRSVRTPVYV